MSRAPVAALLVVASALSARAQDPRGTIGDRLLENIRQFSKVPGHAAAVVVAGEVVWSGETGLADVDARIAVEPSSRFRLASVSKLYTATLLLKLSEAGELDLDADVRRYIADWPKRDEGVITLRQLAAHTSGIPHYGGAGTRRPPAHHRVRSTLEALDFFSDAPLVHAPGDAYTYSSYGYAVLAAVASEITGEPFPHALLTHLLEPAGLRETEVEDVRRLPDEAVLLYDVDDSGSANPIAANDQSYVWGATGMRASARDVARFGYRFLTGAIVPAPIVANALTPMTLSDGSPAGIGRFHVGFGWRVGDDWDGRPVAHHSGLTPGARSVLMGYPDEGVAAALLSNATWTSRVETTAELLAAPFLGTPEQAAAECLDGDYRVDGTFDGKSEAGTLTLTADGALCTASLSSEGELGRRFPGGVFPAVRVASRQDAHVFALAYPWGLAEVRVTPVGEIVTLVGDFAGRAIALRGVSQRSAAAARYVREGTSPADRSPLEAR